MRADFVVDTLHESVQHVVNYVQLCALRVVVLLVVNVPETERLVVPFVLPEVFEDGFFVLSVNKLSFEVIELEFQLW